MTDDGFEALSRLLEGELPAPEAEALRDRIAHEPDLARRWEAMQKLAGDLDALPRPAPPAVDAALAVGEPRQTMRSSPVRAAIPWAIAAAAVLALFLTPFRSAEPDVHLLEGTQRLEGHVHALAGTVPVEVEGIVQISVEPDPGVARVWGAREDPMPKTAILSALAGAVVTVTVYEGRALVRGPDGGDPVVVEAGHSHTTGPGSETRRTRLPAGPPAARPSGTPEQAVAALEAENAALREQLREAEFAGAIAKGQLTAHQGTPVDWPASVPEGLRPEAFEANLTATLADHPDYEIVSLDCSEYPCIAVLTGPAGHDGWQDDIQKIPHEFAETRFPDENLGMQMMLAATDDGETTTGGVGFAILPEGPDGPEAGVDTRTGYRTRQLLDSFVER